MSQIDKVFLGSSSIAVFATAAITPAATAAAVSAEQAFTLVGPPALFSTDIVVANMVAPGNALAVSGARINATGQLVLNFTNPTAGALTYPAGVVNLVVIRP